MHSVHAMQLRQLEQFLAVAETGSFSKGAARAHVSQPPLSTAIGKLEDDLGGRSLHRLARQVTLTSEGHRLLAGAGTIAGKCEIVRSDPSKCGSLRRCHSVGGKQRASADLHRRA